MKWKNLPTDTSIFFVTATITDWQPLFLQEQPRQIVFEDWDFYRNKYGSKIIAYTMMPEHYHMIVDLRTPAMLHRWLADVQGHTANELSKWLRATAHPAHLRVFEARADKSAKFGVWKEQARAVGITSRDVLRTKIEYLHANPVRRGLVDDPADWQWSSYRNYFLGDQSVFQVDRVALT